MALTKQIAVQSEFSEAFDAVDAANAGKPVLLTGKFTSLTAVDVRHAQALQATGLCALFTSSS